MENKLQVIIQESGLDTTKAKFILDNFQSYFEIADEWTRKANTIVVTNEKQKADMQMARAGRLFLREKRIAIEKARKELKEQALREGKAIDGIANVLKALIVPIEEYLEKQERFVEIQAEKKAEALRLEVEKRIEDERIAKEKADAEEQIRIKAENEKLKAEAEIREKQIKEERQKAEAEKAEIEKKAAEERARQEKILTAEKAKAEAARKEAEAKAAKEKEEERQKAEKERKEKEKLAEILKNQIECPYCHKKFSIK